MRVQIYSDDPLAAAPLQKRLEQANIAWLSYQPGQAIECTHFILFSPVWCNDQFVVADPIWMKFFRKTSKKTRLITAGYEQVEHDNYLYLNHIPSELSLFLEETLPCSDNSWSPMKIEGLDVARLLWKFYLGHGDDSVLDAFDKISGKVWQIEKERADTPYEEIFELLVKPTQLPFLWQTFRNRWGHFQHYLLCLPFYPQFRELDDIIKKIDVFFQTGCTDVRLFAELEVAQHAERIKSILEACIDYAR
jgi:hypothetical protein